MSNTKLPWVFDNKFNIYSSDATGSIVATTDGFNLAPRPDEEKEANARLIVNAVNHHHELLEALKYMTERTESLCDHFSDDIVNWEEGVNACKQLIMEIEYEV